MDTGENAQALRTIMDFVRKSSIVLLLVHIYYYCYTGLQNLGFTHQYIDKIFHYIAGTGLFVNPNISKIGAIILLTISVIGHKGKKAENEKATTIIIMVVAGIVIYFSSVIFFWGNLSAALTAVGYIVMISAGFILYLSGISRLSRLINVSLGKDIFNEENETFPQEEVSHVNDQSINLPGIYRYKGKLRKMYVSLVNAARMVLIIGGPGSGKSWFIVREVIQQSIRNAASLVVYDFKYDDLAKIVYNTLLKEQHRYKNPPSFYVIDFDNPKHRCNPLEPATMSDITDATESARTILLGLNLEWVRKTGDFWVESPINFLTAVIWFLRKYKDGRYCTLPHAIELMQLDYDTLFPILGTEPEIEVFIGWRPSNFLVGANLQK